MDSPATVLGLGLVDAQSVVVPLNFQSGALPNLLSVFQPIYSWSQPRVHLAWNQNARIRLVLFLGHPNPNTDLTHSGPLWCRSDWSTVVPARRSRGPVNAGSWGGRWTTRCVWTSYYISHELLLSRCRVHRAIHLCVKHDLKSKPIHLPSVNHLHVDTVRCRRSAPIISLAGVRAQVRQCHGPDIFCYMYRSYNPT